MSYLGSESCLALENVTADGMKALIDRAMSEAEQPRNVGHLKALVGDNGILAGKLLRS